MATTVSYQWFDYHPLSTTDRFNLTGQSINFEWDNLQYALFFNTIESHCPIHVLSNVSRHTRQELITSCQCHLDDTCSRTLEIMVPFSACTVMLVCNVQICLCDIWTSRLPFTIKYQLHSYPNNMLGLSTFQIREVQYASVQTNLLRCIFYMVKLWIILNNVYQNASDTTRYFQIFFNIFDLH